MMSYEFHDYDDGDEYSPLDDSGGGGRRKARKKKRHVRLPPEEPTYRGGKSSKHQRNDGSRCCRCCCCLCRCCSCWTVFIILSILWSTWLTLWLVNTYLLGNGGLSWLGSVAGESGEGSSGPRDAILVKIPYEVASRTDAFCLDGSEPAFYYRAGHDKGADSWIIHLPDGQWCYNKTNCLHRSRTSLGSSSNIPSSVSFMSSGILSHDHKTNPDFFNWNAVRLHYCDGASFTSDVPSPVSVEDDGVIYQRGAAILDSIMSYLLNTTDMGSAKRVILTGSGSGGLGVLFRADHVRSQLPVNSSFHALMDSAFYLDTYNRSNFMHIRLQFQRIFNLHHLQGSFDEDCVHAQSTREQGSTWRCMFPQYAAQYVQTPLFLVNSMYDPWSLWFVLDVRCHASDCPELTPLVERFGADVVKRVKGAVTSVADGVFLTSCYASDLIGRGWDHVDIAGVSVMETFGGWYFGRSMEAKNQSGPKSNATVIAPNNSTGSRSNWLIDCSNSMTCNDNCDWGKNRFQRITKHFQEIDDFFISDADSSVHSPAHP